MLLKDLGCGRILLQPFGFCSKFLSWETSLQWNEVILPGSIAFVIIVKESSFVYLSCSLEGIYGRFCFYWAAVVECT